MDEPSERQPLLNGHDGDRPDQAKQIVRFAEGHDPNNPRNWSREYKWFCVALLCASATVVTYTCIGIVPVAGDVIEELTGRKDRGTTVLFVTIWELGEAMGPLFIAPLSELYGRYAVYNIANGLFVVGVVVTAVSREIRLLIFARFATGCAVAANVLNPAIIGDLFPSESRGSAMSAVMLAPLIGGALGPTISGSLAEATGWREIMWLCVAVASVTEVLLLALFRETYAPAILERLAAEKRRETGDESWTSVYERQDQSTWRKIITSMLRPARIFYSSSMLQCLAGWGGLVFAFFYVNSTSLPEILDVVYGFGPAKRGISYLAWTAGSCIGILTCNRAMDPIYRSLSKRHGTHYPEGRLPLVICGSILLPLAVALYGWSAEAHAPVMLYLSTVSLLCVAVVLSIVPMMTFITDAFGAYSASATTALLVARCLLGAFLPLTVPPLAQRVGYGWGFSALAAVCLVAAPVPAVVMWLGSAWRQRSEYTGDEV